MKYKMFVVVVVVVVIVLFCFKLEGLGQKKPFCSYKYFVLVMLTFLVIVENNLFTRFHNNFLDLHNSDNSIQ